MNYNHIIIIVFQAGKCLLNICNHSVLNAFHVFSLSSSSKPMEYISLLIPFIYEEHEIQNKLSAQSNTELCFELRKTASRPLTIMLSHFPNPGEDTHTMGIWSLGMEVPMGGRGARLKKKSGSGSRLLVNKLFSRKFPIISKGQSFLKGYKD